MSADSIKTEKLKSKVLGNDKNVGQPLNAYGCSDNRGGLGSCKKCINHKFASQAIEVELNGAELKFAFTLHLCSTTENLNWVISNPFK